MLHLIPVFADQSGMILLLLQENRFYTNVFPCLSSSASILASIISQATLRTQIQEASFSHIVTCAAYLECQRMGN